MLPKKNTIENFTSSTTQSQICNGGVGIGIPGINYFETKQGAFAILQSDYNKIKQFIVNDKKFRLLNFRGNRPSTMDSKDSIWNLAIKQRTQFDNTLIITGTSNFTTPANVPAKIWINFRGNAIYLNDFVFPDNCIVDMCFL
jgi:hypothetical protein